MTQTGAIFMEAYRNLNSKKLFWIVLVISVIVVGAFAIVGLNEDGIKIGFWQFDDPIVLNSNVIPPAEFYKGMFVRYGIGAWLSFVATILALVSTAGIFVDLVTSGSIDLVLSKPMGRLRLFVTQYVAALLFVTLQITLFTMGGFLLIGIRGGEWEPSLFVAIPMVVCFFSYLFSVCVLLGIMTRSTVAALLLTILFWLGLIALSGAEKGLLVFETMSKQGVTLSDVSNQQQGLESKAKGSSGHDGGDKARSQKEKNARWLSRTHDIVFAIKTVLPKTDETVGLLKRWLLDSADLEDQPGDSRNQKARNVDKELNETFRSRSVAWIVGTSLGFELIVLSLAAFLFCRRDY